MSGRGTGGLTVILSGIGAVAADLQSLSGVNAAASGVAFSWIISVSDFSSLL